MGFPQELKTVRFNSEPKRYKSVSLSAKRLVLTLVGLGHGVTAVTRHICDHAALAPVAPATRPRMQSSPPPRESSDDAKSSTVTYTLRCLRCSRPSRTSHEVLVVLMRDHRKLHAVHRAVRRHDQHCARMILACSVSYVAVRLDQLRALVAGLQHAVDDHLRHLPHTQDARARFLGVNLKFRHHKVVTRPR